MTLSADIAADLASLDGAETVSLYDASANTTDATVTAIRGPLTRGETYFGPAGIEPTDVAFNIQASTTAVVPAPQDKITDSANTAYTIITVSKMTLGSRYRCVCRQQA